MAEPLLRRTFSRLRGKDRTRRKTEPKMSEVLQKSSSSSMTRTLPAADPDTLLPPQNHIPVAKKEVWQGFSVLSPSLQSGCAPRNCNRIPQDAYVQTWSQRSAHDKVPGCRTHQCGDKECVGQSSDTTGTPCVPVSSTIVSAEDPHPPGASPDVPATSVSSKLSDQHAYLQSLDRASRAWVLSSGKTQTLDEACGVQQESSNIWYNPIPEEEDAVVPCREEIWRRRDERKEGGAARTTEHEGGLLGSTESSSGDFPLDKMNRSVRHHTDVINTENPDIRPAPTKKEGVSANGRDSTKEMSRPEMAVNVSEFRLYVGSNPPRSSQRVTGLLTVHLLGLEEMKTSRSEGNKEVFLAIQIDGVTRARTSLLTLRGCTLPLNHTFHLELERARLLRIVVLTPVCPPAGSGSKTGMDQTLATAPRNRVCGLGGVSIPPLFKGSRSQQLSVKLEPRGLLYVKLSLQEKWDTQRCTDQSGPSNVFGVELHHLVEKEGSSSQIPLLIQKSVEEIEHRGLKVVGLYRLCGSAAVKKELRDWFERNSLAVCLSEDLYPDINVITGILKDYLRELPSPLITRTLYQVIRQAMTLRPLKAPPWTPEPQLAQITVELLACLPPPERATLSLLLDHLSLVASLSSLNRMTHQNLAVCFGPVLLTPTQEAWKGGRGGKVSSHGEEMANAVDFKRHIEALHYLLQLWPVPTHQLPADDHIDVSLPPSPALTQNPHGKQQWRPILRLTLPQNPEVVVVSRRGRGGSARLESPPPINRYAGDWSICGRDLLSGQDADYDEVAGSESDRGSGDEGKNEARSSGGGLSVGEFMDFEAPFNCRLSLKDFDTLIHDLDRELAKQIKICL
ncbi:rho GTPase-activating protein SYDE1 isoform 5-T5 [Spinachia spinachia]